MNTGLILIACGFVSLAITINVFARLRGKSRSKQGWLTRDLHRGDLRALANLVYGPGLEVSYDQIGRLKDRGFVTKSIWGGDRVTVKGHAALILRIVFARKHPLSGTPV